jgi:hypothetical protein
MIPLAVGHVGRGTFVAAALATSGMLAGLFALLRLRLRAAELRRRLVLPGLSVFVCFLAFYLVGFVPPVPIAAKKLGVYHHVERRGGEYVLTREAPPSIFGWLDRRTFVARPGDRVFVFVAIFSPARFDDTVFVRWQVRDATGGWTETDRIPIQIAGGRREGFRGYTTKANYRPGDWRVRIEARDGREIARRYFTVVAAEADPARTWVTEVQ